MPSGLRIIENWISNKKSEADRRSGYSWGVLVHGNRALASSVFHFLGQDKLAVPISDFKVDFAKDVEAAC